MRTTCFLLLISVVAISANLESDFVDILKDLQNNTPKDVDREFVAIKPRIAIPTDFKPQRFLEEFLELTDVKKAVDFLKAFGIDIKTIVSTVLKNALPEEPVLGGLLRAASSAKLSAAIQKKIETSPEFARFALIVQNRKFKELVYKAMNSKEVLDKIQAYNA